MYQVGCGTTAVVLPRETGLKGIRRTARSFCDDAIALPRDGLIEEASHSMEPQGIRPDSKVYASLLKGCADAGYLPGGMKVHVSTVKSGFDSDIFLQNNLVAMYAKCGSLEHARQVFDKMSQRDVVSWTAIMAGCAQHDYGEEAIKLLIEMQRAGMKPDKFTFSVVLKACATVADLEQGKQVHSHVLKSGFELGTFVGSALVDMYVKCGSIDKARLVFDNMFELNVVSWTSMIAGYTRDGVGDGNEAMRLFCQMRRAGVNPDVLTFGSVLMACSSLACLELGKQVHAHTIKAGFQSDVCVGGALVDMYAKCCSVDAARQLFDGMPKQSVILWTAMIAGYAQNEHGEDAWKLFCEMQGAGLYPNQFTFAGVLCACGSTKALELGKQTHARVIRTGYEDDDFVGSAIVDMYAKCSVVEDARQIFCRIPEPDLVVWTAMVSGYAQNGQGELALETFCQMQQVDKRPNQFTFASVLVACTGLAALEQGKQVHAQIIKSGFMSDVCVESTLVNMYAKCGSIADAKEVFHKKSVRNVILWTVIIVGCAQHGLGEDALKLFKQMLLAGMKPDHVTFVGVLCACSHAGLLDEGRHLFNSMSRDHGVTPGVEHYVCMVDLFGRAGHLDEAERFIKGMPFKHCALVWQALLSACKIHGNLELGERVAGYLLESEPQEAAAYVLLSSIYAASGRWDAVGKVRKMMKDKRVKKDPGSSWIEVKNRVHVFVVEDISHPEMEGIL